MKQRVASLVQLRSNIAQHLIYVPGLGDGYTPVRRFALRFWREKGMHVSLLPMRWADRHETYEQKIARLHALIDTRPDDKLVLVGESAGGAVVLAALRSLGPRVDRVVTICGMNHGASSVGAHIYRKNSAFRAAMQATDEVTSTLTQAEKGRIKTVYSSRDLTVRPKHTLLPGVDAVDIKVPGHLHSILSVLLKHSELVVQA
ncbi:MAG TPA: alpha/beta hydrolase [Candidatus Saccharimonadales bacterium]